MKFHLVTFLKCFHFFSTSQPTGFWQTEKLRPYPRERRIVFCYRDVEAPKKLQLVLKRIYDIKTFFFEIFLVFFTYSFNIQVSYFISFIFKPKAEFK